MHSPLGKNILFSKVISSFPAISTNIKETFDSTVQKHEVIMYKSIKSEPAEEAVKTN